MGVAQVLEPLTTNFKALSSNPSTSLAPVAHACNPSFSGGRDQEE
jgi:hypothetical protein